MGKVQNIDPSDIYIINNEAQCVALSITTSIADAIDCEMFSRRSLSEYVDELRVHELRVHELRVHE